MRAAALFPRNTISLADYDQLIHAVYDAVFDATKLGQALLQLKQIFAANNVTLILPAKAGEPVPMLVASDHHRQCEVYYYQYDHLGSFFDSRELEAVFDVFDHISPEDWREHSLYQAYFRPFNIFHTLAVDIGVLGEERACLRIGRSAHQPAFSAGERQVLQTLVPHIKRALTASAMRDQSQHLEALYSQTISRFALATILLDADGVIVHTNAAAENLLEQQDGLKRVGNKLKASFPRQQTALQKLLESALLLRLEAQWHESVALSLPRPSGAVNLGLVAVPVAAKGVVQGNPPAIMLYIRDSQGPLLPEAGLLKELFKLTPAETALALKLCEGITLEEACGELDIRRNTGRAHLRAIFSKTNVNRQTELVRLLLGHAT